MSSCSSASNGIVSNVSKQCKYTAGNVSFVSSVSSVNNVIKKKV